ncbi:hypothetical protein LXA43DRAFT_1048637 [Ganoderma leucocontextum]|nr:hypothetical protein LXA43DRAFT_1048637 [Ganoderma leucocontextum]
MMAGALLEVSAVLASLVAAAVRKTSTLINSPQFCTRNVPERRGADVYECTPLYRSHHCSSSLTFHPLREAPGVAVAYPSKLISLASIPGNMALSVSGIIIVIFCILFAIVIPFFSPRRELKPWLSWYTRSQTVNTRSRGRANRHRRGSMPRERHLDMSQ